jgi:uncharacterized protein (DUF433 family)
MPILTLGVLTMPKKKAEIEIRQGAGGESAYIVGTRVRVADIARLYPQVLDELIIDRIVQSLPTLDRGQVRAAIEYWRTHPGEIESLIEEEAELLDKFPHAG